MKKNVKKGMIPYLLLIVFVLSIYYILSLGGSKVNDLTYDKLISEIKGNNVEEIIITPNANEGTYNISGNLKTMVKEKAFMLRLHLLIL